eukprot:193201-Amphidinium_carterae.2
MLKKATFCPPLKKATAPAVIWRTRALSVQGLASSARKLGESNCGRGISGQDISHLGVLVLRTCQWLTHQSILGA